MNKRLSHEELLGLLPHGEDLVGITEITSYGDKELSALAAVGQAEALLSRDGRLLPDSLLELCTQAAALGSNLKPQTQAEEAAETELSPRGGVITKVRTLEIPMAEKMPEKGEMLLLQVYWTEPVGGAFEVTGEVFLEQTKECVGKVNCMVMETR